MTSIALPAEVCTRAGVVSAEVAAARQKQMVAKVGVQLAVVEEAVEVQVGACSS